MTRRIILAAALAGSVLSANAQEKESKWSITPRVGVEISDFANDKMEIYSPRGGYGIGVEAERRLSKLLGLSAGVFYTKQEVRERTQRLVTEDNYFNVNILYAAGKNTENIRKYIDETDLVMLCHEIGSCHEIEQVSVPLLINLRVWNGLTVKAGIEYDYLSKAKRAIRYVNVLAETDPVIYYFDDNGLISQNNQPYVAPVEIVGPKTERNYKWKGSESARFHRNNISIPVGVAYNYKNFELDARYLFGITKLLPHDTFGNNLRTSTFLITLGYRISL